MAAPAPAPDAGRVAAALQAAVPRQTLQESVKASGGKDLAAWAALIRYDAILAAAAATSAASPPPAPAAGDASPPAAGAEAWRVVDRLAGQAYLANRDTVKSQPVPYIELTLDQARANL